MAHSCGCCSLNVTERGLCILALTSVILSEEFKLRITLGKKQFVEVRPPSLHCLEVFLCVVFRGLIRICVSILEDALMESGWRERLDCTYGQVFSLGYGGRCFCRTGGRACVLIQNDRKVTPKAAPSQVNSPGHGSHLAGGRFAECAHPWRASSWPVLT